MALVALSGNESIDMTSAMDVTNISGDLFAGEALLIAAPCYIKSSDGKVYMSNGTAANAAAAIDGWTPMAYNLGEAVTLFARNVKFEYGSGLTPGATLYLGATAGRLDTAATTGDAVGSAKVINAHLIRAIRDV